uniref:60S acidic ribosomal protein P2 n=1 Tax=Phaeodactylum tricornutum TaxID=2850 RepID=A0A8J9X3U5_PHATR
MKHLAAYLLLQLGGNASPTKDDITQALSAVGVEVDGADLDRMLADLEGQDLEALLESGNALLATFGGGGGGGGGAAAAGGEAAVEEKVEEKEEEEEMDLGGGMDMFGAEEGGGGDY